jgi:hypothetical protein
VRERHTADLGDTSRLKVARLLADYRGTVVAQNPAGGKIREGSSVRLNVSTGTPP